MVYYPPNLFPSPFLLIAFLLPPHLIFSLQHKIQKDECDRLGEKQNGQEA